MKNKTLTLMLTTVVFATNSGFAMEKPEERIPSKPISKKMEFIELHDQDVEYITGANLKYYGEYRPKQLEKNLLSFPLAACDPLSIQQFGELRFFFTSAIGGNCPRMGEPIVVPSPSMEVRAVRAKANSNGHWAQVYFGYEPNQYNLIGKKKIYQAQLLVAQSKNTQHVESSHTKYSSGAKYLDNQLIGLEVRTYLENPLDWNWNSPIFKSILDRFLLNREGIFFGYGCLSSQIVYWTKEENKLKQIRYCH